LKETESKQAMTGIWDWGHSVRHQFDTIDEWSGLELTTDHVKTGKYSMRWKDHTKPGSTSTKKFMTDWSDVEYVTLSLYNVVVNTENLVFILFSQNSSSSGDDYYSYNIYLNWTGWKTFNLTKSNFTVSRYPVGWDSINEIRLSAAWSGTQNATSDLYLDSMMFWRKDGTEIDSFKGLEQFIPQVSHSRKTFYDLNAPSNLGSRHHAVSVIRQNTADPIVQVLRPHTETNFVSSFTQSDDKTFVIKTKSETVTVNSGDLESDYPCSTVTRKANEKGTVTTTNLACERVSLTDSNNKDLTVSFYSTEGSVISLQKGGSASFYDDVEESITFENVKLPGKKKIGIDVRVCSRVNGLSVMFNGKYADILKEKSNDKNDCVTESFSIKLDASPFAKGNLTVFLKDMNNLDGASNVHCCIVLIFVTMIINLLQ